eukprot:1111131-Pleurochrysis_carterae.AAC.1
MLGKSVVAPAPLHSRTHVRSEVLYRKRRRGLARAAVSGVLGGQLLYAILLPRPSGAETAGASERAL